MKTLDFNVTRNGKIARLPWGVRERLNRRLQDGEQGPKLLAWLNGLPEVRAALEEMFEGRAITAQNLTQWRKGGYREWRAQEDAKEMAERLMEEVQDVDGIESLTETLAVWVAARYAVATRTVVEAEGEKGWKLLREMCADVRALRRGNHSAQRLELERERLAVARHDGELKWKRKIEIGLETLTKYVAKHPQAEAAMRELARAVEGGGGKDEGGRMKDEGGPARNASRSDAGGRSDTGGRMTEFGRLVGRRMKRVATREKIKVNQSGSNP